MKNSRSSWKEQLEKKIVNTIERQPGFSEHRRLLRVLYLCSKGFEIFVRLREFLYDKGWKKSRKASLPVVCIGNITAGGTGKTPFIHLLVQDLKALTKLAVISTGYKAQGVCKNDVITPQDQNQKYVPPAYCGDEPYLLKRKHPDIEVLISKDRFLALEVALKKGRQLALLDDGFQMRSLKKDLSVILMHADNLFGYGHYLPRGYLRESPRRLKEAQFICITGVEGHCFEDLCRKLAPYSQAKVMGAERKSLRILGDINWKLEEVKGKKVGVFCGIGQPASYMHSLKKLGVDIVNTLVVNDHAMPSDEQWKVFIQECQEKKVDVVLCTEKDFVKLEGHVREIPVSYLDTELTIVYGQKHYRALKQQILQLSKQKRVKT